MATALQRTVGYCLKIGYDRFLHSSSQFTVGDFFFSFDAADTPLLNNMRTMQYLYCPL